MRTLVLPLVVLLGRWTPCAAAPTQAAVIEERPAEARRFRLALVDLQTGASSYLTPKVEHLGSPVWSADGRWLAYWQDRDVLTRAIDQDEPPHRVAHTDGSHAALAFSPDGQSLALALDEGGFLIRRDGTLRKRVQLPRGCVPNALRWAADGGSLHLLCYDDRAKKTHLLRLEIATDRLVDRKLDRPLELLGWRKRPAGVIATREGSALTEAVLLAEDGTSMVLQRHSSEEWSFQQYLPTRDAFLVCGMGEDEGDPTRCRLAPVEGGPARPWLRRYPKLRTPAFSEDDAWVLFVNAVGALAHDGADCGDVHLAPTSGEEGARRVLRAGEVRCYQAAIPRPSLR